MEVLIRTKLFPPPVPAKLIPRPRLVARLNEPPPLTLISAPPGFGKSTLLAEWRTSESIKLAWLSLDEDDNRPSRFLAYFISALQGIDPQVGAASALLLQSTSDAKTVLAPLLNDLNHLNSPLVLVLDDYHVIRAGPIHELLTFILEHQPASLRLIILSRSDPPLPLARLRGRGQLAEIRADELRFTAEEAVAFLNQIVNLHLRENEIATLAQHTEGWIAGLQLAAQSMQGKTDVHQFVSTLSGRNQTIGDYLTEEVFNHQSEVVQRFLLQTCILDSLCATLCDAVMESQGSQRLLDKLSRSNILLISLDNKAEWYRYHHLFSEYLRGRVENADEEHRRASDWFEKNGYLSEAIKHSIAAGDDGTALRLIKESAPVILGRGDPTSLLQLVESLPMQARSADTRLLLYIAIARFLLGDEEGVNQALQHVKTSIKNLDHEDTLSTQTELDAIELSIVIEHCAEAEDIERARRLLQHIPSENVFLRASLFFGLGDAYYSNGNVALAKCTPNQLLEEVH